MNRPAVIRVAVRVTLLKLGEDLPNEGKHVLGCQDCFEIVASVARREYRRLLPGLPAPTPMETARMQRDDAAFFERFHFTPPHAEHA